MTDEQPPLNTEPCPEVSPPPPEPEPYPFWGYSEVLLFAGLAIPCMLAGWAVVHGIFVLLHIPTKPAVLELLPEQLLGYALLFGCLAVILRIQYDKPFWQSLAWTDTRVPVSWITTSGLICALAVALLGSLIHTPTTANPMTELMKDRTSAILMAIFGVTMAPLSEELAFRGFLQPLLVRSLGAVPGILATTIPFGLLHFHEYGNSWRHAVLIGLAGATFGWMRHATGSTKASTVMHASYNALIFFAVFSAGKNKDF